MSKSREESWPKILARLRRGVAAGDAAAMTELALTINDGIRDSRGRVLVRRNAPYSFRLLRRAIASGHEDAAFALGCAYDIGQGIRQDKALALKWYRRGVRHGSKSAASNIATVYRDRARLGQAHRWAVSAMEMGDGDAAVTAGYNCLYGIGVRRNTSMARRLFQRALRGDTTQYGREEALYHFAVSYLDEGRHKPAIRLLKQANNDQDYHEAASLLAQLDAKHELNPCRCRRHLLKDLNGHAPCAQHPRPRRAGG
jgi:TPR repeat protein